MQFLLFVTFRSFTTVDTSTTLIFQIAVEENLGRNKLMSNPFQVTPKYFEHEIRNRGKHHCFSTVNFI